MTTNDTQSKKTDGEAKKPDWVVKAPRGYGRKSRLERVGVAWSRDDKGICVKLVGKQVVDSEMYLYPINGDSEGDAQ